MTLALQGSPSTACTEHELVAAVRRGDDRAFELLFSRYERRITAYVASMVGDYARAEDITQDVFISALRRIRETQRPIAFKPWIYEIAKNASIDEFRRARRSQEVSFEDDDGFSFAARNVYVHAPPPQAAIESKQRLDDLCGAFGGLSESHHRVLVLRELEGLSYAEIGERLGMTRAMVESTLFRARRRLSEEYEDLASGRRCARVQSLIDAGGGQPLTSLGMRDRRQLSRHLAHCEPCRRRARIDGVDETLLAPRRRVARIAALLPLPLLRWRRGASSNEVAAQSGTHSVAVAQSLQTVTQIVDPSVTSEALGRAAAAAAAVAIAGAGGGLVANLNTPIARLAQPARPPASAPAVSRPAALSFTKILAPVSTAPAKTLTGYPATLAVLITTGGGTVASTGPSGAGFGGPVIVGPVPAHAGGGTASPPGAPSRPGGGGAGTAQPPAGGGGSGSGGSAGSGGSGASGSDGSGPTSGGSSGNGVSLPGSAPQGGSSGPDVPQVPSPPSGAPSAGGPQQPTDPSGGGGTVQVPDSSSVQATAQSAPTTVTQTVQQVQQSPPTVPTNVAVSPPPGS